MATDSNEEFFAPLSASKDQATVLESLCVNCEENGITKLLFVEIPFYREVIISSFSCPHCHYQNSEIQSASEIQMKGLEIKFRVTRPEDINRQIVKTDTAMFKIEELNFEIPAKSQKGTLSTLEGIIQRTIDGLEQDQPVRRVMHPEESKQIDEFVIKLKKCLTVETPFTVLLDDASGNSFIENPFAPKDDRYITTRQYKRNAAQNKLLGLVGENEDPVKEKEEINIPETTEELDLHKEVVTFVNACSSCGVDSTTNMKMLSVPHFKEVMIMATSCDNCGHKSNEIKSASGYGPKGKKITLKYSSSVDLSRDLLKSETCEVLIPEIELQTGSMALSGKFTTVEGLLQDIKTMLVDSNPFVGGDSANSEKLKEIGEKIDAFASGELNFTLILDDPVSNSYIQDIYAPEVDPCLTVEEYERTHEQNEELGLNDMKTDNY